MATLQVGWYPINNHTSEHAYAKMEAFGAEYRFHCYGGVYDNENYYPAEFYEPRSIFYTRDSSRTNLRTLSCDPSLAISLASWSISIDFNRYDYNMTSGGTTGLGDCSGLVYAVTGVCHQMCNIITCASNSAAPLTALINWPPSLNASKLVYGNRGCPPMEQIVEDFISHIRGRLRAANSEAPVTTAVNELNDKLNEYNTCIFNAIKETLKNGHSVEERAGIVGSVICDCVEQEKLQQAVLEHDNTVMTEKNELDNMLLRRQVSFQEYVEKVNGLLSSLVKRYEEVMGQDKFADLFGAEADGVNCNIIDTKMMSEEAYDTVRKNLGI